MKLLDLLSTILAARSFEKLALFIIISAAFTTTEILNGSLRINFKSTFW